MSTHKIRIQREINKIAIVLVLFGTISLTGPSLFIDIFYVSMIV